jgi:predicted component of type VI protein secretion system
VTLVCDSALSLGSIAIDVEHPDVVTGARLSLRVEHGVPVGKSLGLPQTSQASVVVGRDPACDFVVTDARVSRRHVRLSLGARGVEFEDLGSSNGTLRNGDLLVRGPLRAGDRLRIGDTTLIVDDGEATA